jgi:hypothetical protein
MSEEYEVHGPHDHAVEHAAHHDADPFASRMAVMTAILATIGALCAYQSGNSENLALFYKNRSIEPVELLPGQGRERKSR